MTKLQEIKLVNGILTFVLVVLWSCALYIAVQYGELIEEHKNLKQQNKQLQKELEESQTMPGFWKNGMWYHCYETHITERRKPE